MIMLFVLWMARMGRATGGLPSVFGQTVQAAFAEVGVPRPKQHSQYPEKPSMWRAHWSSGRCQ
jgi:hypothetical protein